MIKINDKEIYPSSEKDLAVKRGIIYAIVNGYNGKIYVGKTKNSFNKRYGIGWWKNTKNILLQRVLKKHPASDFTIYILEDSIEPQNLDEKEKFYASYLNCYCPNGYNVRECGEEGLFFGEEAKKRVKRGHNKKNKKYRIRKIETDEEFIVNNLEEWSKKNNVSAGALRNMLCGISLSSQGYCLPKYYKKDILRIRKEALENIRKKEYEVRVIGTDKCFRFRNVNRFVKEQGIDKSSFKLMLSGKTKQSHGFCLKNTIIQVRYFYIKSETGETIQFKQGDYTKICKKINICRQSLEKIQTGAVKCFKGWFLERIEDVQL